MALTGYDLIQNSTGLAPKANQTLTLGATSPLLTGNIGVPNDPIPAGVTFDNRPPGQTNDLGYNTGYDPAAAKAAADEAARVAKVKGAKTAITGLVGSLQGVYDALYGDVSNAATEKTRLLDQKYGTDVNSLTDSFNAQFPQIGNAYGARGTYDSSYRIDAEEGAKKGFNNSIEQLGQGRRQDLAGVGQYISQQNADIGAQKGGLDAVLSHIGESDNADELIGLRNTLDEKLRTLQASRAGLQGQNTYLNTLNSTVGGDRISSLQTGLTNVINAQIPLPLKQAIGSQIINQSGLPAAQVQQALASFGQQLAATEPTPEKQPVV